MCFFPKVNCFCIYRKLVTWATNAKGLSLPCTYSSPYSTHTVLSKTGLSEMNWLIEFLDNFQSNLFNPILMQI